MSSAFDSMVGQIEAAFDARRASEEAARASEEAARASEEAARASEEAARASEERMRRFVADASHELRTPLASIRGFAELYRQGAVPEPKDVDRVMGRIESQSQRMGVLVDDLLLLARLDQQRPLRARARRPPHPRRRRDARGAGDRAGTRHRAAGRPRASDPRSSSATTCDCVRSWGTCSATRSCTPLRTAPITVTVGVDGGSATVDVKDEGPGMAPADAQHVFERFYRADTSRTRAIGGNGLGLSIAAALVAAHDGTLSVETAPGRGATFRVRLPLLVPAAV